MDKQTIEVLLEKYLEGETSLKEEAILRTYFSQEQNLPEAWLPYRHFFSFFQEAKKETYPLSEKRVKKSNKVWMFAAASILLVVAVQFSGILNTQSPYANQQEAEMVFHQFQTQMKTVSNHFNRGVEKVAYLDYWNESTQKLIK